jgi:hypothetical protein
MDLNIVSKDGSVITMPYTQNEDAVKNKLTVHEHPHPFTILIILLIICYLGYLVYVEKLKTDLSGTWYMDTKKITITHDKYGCGVVVSTSDSDDTNDTGHVVGHAIYMDKTIDGLHSDIGVYQNNKIYWVNQDSVWTKAKD